MSETNEVQIELFAKSLDHWKELSKKRLEAIKSKQHKELEQLFAAYEGNEPYGLENLSKWILKTIRKGVYKKYYEVDRLPGGAEAAAEVRISEIMEEMTPKLVKHSYISANQLHGHIGLNIGQSHGKALAVRDKDPHLFALFIVDEDGEEREVNFRKKELVHSPLNRENAFLLRYLPPNDREFFMTLRQHSWDFETVQTELGLSECALDKRIRRVGSRMEDMRNLLTAFKVPLRPHEHRFDLAQRFSNLVRRLEGMRGSQLPTTFEDLRTLCADRTPCTTTTVRTHALIVVRHILRLWRQHTALQSVSAINPTH